MGDYIDVGNPGGGLTAVLGNNQDSSAAMQALVNAVIALDTSGKGNVPIWLKLGGGWNNNQYRWNSTVDFGQAGKMMLIGSGPGTNVAGNVAGPLLQRASTAPWTNGQVRIYGINFQNYNTLGTCVQLDAVNGGIIQDCYFNGWRGFVCGTGPNHGQTLGLRVRDCTAGGPAGGLPAAGSIGGSVSSSTSIGFLFGGGVAYASGLEAYSCGIGIRVANDLQLSGYHCEESGIGLQCGLDYNGNDIATKLQLIGMSLESQGICGLEIHKASNNCYFNLGDFIGDEYQAGTPSLAGYANYGVWIEGGQYLTIQGGSAGGSYAQSAVKIANAGGPMIFKATSALNGGSAGSTTKWDVSGAGANFLQEGCNYP
jgi:hypothetical protein